MRMAMQKPTKTELKLYTQDPKEFCIRIATEIQTDIDPTFLANLNFDRIRRYFFVGQGWRLTRTGCETLSSRYISYSSASDANTVITGKIILNMDNAVGGPWYLWGQKITVFDPTAHFELQMMGGNMNAFVDFKSST